MKNKSNIIINVLFVILIIALILILLFLLRINSNAASTQIAESSKNTYNQSSITYVNSVSNDILTSNINNSSKDDADLPFDTEMKKTKSGTEYNEIALLEIPSLDIKYPVLSSTSTELLKISLNKYWGCDPNEVGNFCIIGHNYNTDKFFSNLHNIEVGDTFKITDNKNRTFEYEVYDTFLVNPKDTSCTSQLTDGKIESTLITCSADGKERFIVKAHLKQ